MPRTWVIGSQHGFTLLELMVVLAILVLVAALFPVALDHALPGHRVRAAAEEFVSTVREAQAASAHIGRPITLRLQNHALVFDGLIPAPPPHSLPQSVDLKMSDSEGRSTAAIVIYPDGSTPGVRLDVAEGEHHAAVMLSAVTGRAWIVHAP